MTKLHALMCGIALSSMPGCVPIIFALTHQVHESDLAAWPGESTDTLLLHPLFSTMPRRVSHLSDGREIWAFSNCETTPVSCDGSTCTGGSSACCDNQFIIRDSRVLEYRPVGKCYTDCSCRPTGECD